MCITHNFTFRTLSLAIFYSRCCIPPLKTITNATFKRNIWRHKSCYLITPKFDSVLNYNYIFHIPTAHSSKKHYKKQPNLYHCYFTPLHHLLLDIIFSYTLPFTSLYLPRESTGAPPPPVSRPTRELSSNNVPPPRLTPRKTPTEGPSKVLPTQLYTSIYFIRYITPHMPYIPLLYPTPIMTHTHLPTNPPHKWLE